MYFEAFASVHASEVARTKLFKSLDVKDGNYLLRTFFSFKFYISYTVVHQ